MIQPANPQAVYVPVYNPQVVYYPHSAASSDTAEETRYFFRATR